MYVPCHSNLGWLYSVISRLMISNTGTNPCTITSWKGYCTLPPFSPTPYSFPLFVLPHLPTPIKIIHDTWQLSLTQHRANAIFEATFGVEWSGVMGYLFIMFAHWPSLTLTLDISWSIPEMNFLFPHIHVSFCIFLNREVVKDPYHHHNSDDEVEKNHDKPSR
jgi:hypothetical protein